MQNRIRKAIQEKGCAVGTFMELATPAIVENLSSCGLDYILIDTEHGTYDLKDVSDLIRAADSKGISPVVRVSEPTHREIQHAADEGAEGIIIPYLREVGDFRKAAQLGKFPPIGSRGYAWGRGSCYGNDAWSSGTSEDYMAASNEKLLLIPQCETIEALENIEEIAQIEGIDGIFIGPWDLSVCMGIPKQFDAPVFQAAVRRILKACKDAGKISIIYTNTVEESRKYLAMGFDAVCNTADYVIYRRGYQDMVRSILGEQ